MPSSYKFVSQDYTLKLGNGTSTFSILGNVVITGSQTNTNPTVSTEPFVTVAANNTANSGVVSMGLLGQLSGGTDQGNATFAGIRYNKDANSWQVSSNVDFAGNPNPGNAYINLATGNVQVAGSDQQVQFNNGGDFGGAANLAYIITGTNTGNASVLRLNGIEQFTHIGGAQSDTQLVANNTLLFGNPVSSGGSGLYFISPDPSNPGGSGYADELISKTKAIVYSIIF